MKENASPERPVIRYFGGKWLLAPWIISHFPKHRIYVEPFGGAASVLMQKEPSYAEVYNDLDGEIVNVFRVLQSQDLSRKLQASLELTPFARDEFNLSYVETADPVERARRTVIRAYMGFGSNGHNSDERTGFRANANRSGTTPAHNWTNYPPEVTKFCERLRGVVIENKDAKSVMAQQDSPETLHFVDPPYVHETRNVTKGYRFEMTNEDHGDLCAFLKTLGGMVVLCGYLNPVYEALGWDAIQRKAYADGAAERVEVLWLNAAAVNAQSQGRLFK